MEKTAVIIVNYRTPWHLNLCLKQLFKHTSDFHLYLVHNQPDGKSLTVGEKYKKLHPDRVTIYINKENLGFTGGVNTPYKEVMQHQRICLLNSDVLVTPGWLSTMTAEMDADPTIAQIGCDTNGYYPDGLFWKLIHILPDPFNRLQLLQYYLGAPKAPNPRAFEPDHIFFNFCGGFCNLFDSKHFTDLSHILDPNIFHGYGDDLDLSLYLRQFGSIGSTLQSYVYHFHNTSLSVLTKKRRNYNKDALAKFNYMYIVKKWKEYFLKHIAESDNAYLLSISDYYMSVPIFIYFALSYLKKDFDQYVDSLPAREIWEKMIQKTD